MLSVRDNFLTAAHGGRPDWVPCYKEEANFLRMDFWTQVDPIRGTDFCNVKWTENEYGRMPREDWRAMRSIYQWRETVKFPDLSAIDWERVVAKVRAEGSPDRANIAMVNTCGIFLIPVNMLGWMDALCSMIEDQEEVEAFVSAITDFLCELVEYEGKYFKPDIMTSGDDVASSGGPFLSRDNWNKLYRPYFKKICDAIKAQGALAEFHCCGNCQYLVQDFLDMGYDIVQLPQINESLLADKQRLGNKLVITGGWDRHGPGSLPEAPEEVVRESVRTAINTFGKDGALLFWDGGICGTSQDSENKRRWVADELRRYGREIYR